jgi:hypothetical protein
MRLRAEGIAQVVEHLPNKPNALSSYPTMIKNKKKE